MHAMNHGGQNIAEETCEVLEDKGYVCGYTLLNAAYYGVPQMRERFPGRLFHPEYRRRFRFGVVSLRPGMQAEELRDVLRTIVADATA